MSSPSRRTSYRRRVTLKDVAQAVGVSQSTTSRALSGEGYVAPAVRDRVRAAAAQLGYVPHAIARSLRKQVSRSIGVLVSDLRNPFYADLAAGVAARARACGYTMMLVDDQGCVEDGLGGAEAFVASRAAGVVLTPVSPAVSSYLLAQGIPVVEAARQFSVGVCDAVVVDSRPVARRVTEHLVALGHRRIALLGDDETDRITGPERSAGYRDALAAAGLPIRQELLLPGCRDVDGARRAAVGLLTQRERPTAVLAANHLLAEGLWRAVGDLGLRVPDDISLISLDDARWMSVVSPGLTAVSQDAVTLGAAAVGLLLERIAAPEQQPHTLVLKAEILPRGSTAGPRPAAT